MSDTVRGSEESLVAASGHDNCSVVVAYSPDSPLIGQRIELHRARTLFVGRHVPGGLSVNDERMSKQHLLILATRDAFACQDAGSTNGTFVNGAVPQTHALEHGDVIRAGDTLLVVETRDPQSATHLGVASAARTNFPILLVGETGTGKELLARSLHEHSGRAGPFVPLNCATLTRDLASAELFGHARGAFSGAASARLGLFRAGAGGTLFLDEIGDLPLDIQPVLLRVLEERKVRPVGTDQEVPVDARVVSATHVDLESAVRSHTFRADLLARLAHVVLTLPPLRERRAEILTLCAQFAPAARFSPSAAEALLLCQWPRNVRELRTVIEATAVLVDKQAVIGLRDLQSRLPEAVGRITRRQGPSSELSVDAPPLAKRRQQLQFLLSLYQGNVSKVAEELGKPRAQVYRWARALGVNVDGYR